MGSIQSKVDLTQNRYSGLESIIRASAPNVPLAIIKPSGADIPWSIKRWDVGLDVQQGRAVEDVQVSKFKHVSFDAP